MKQNTLLHAAFSVLVVIVVLQFAALQYSLYYLYPWYDIMMHFIGGIFIAFLLFWFFFFSEYVERLHPSVTNILLVGLFGSFVVGVGWEVFEYAIGNIPKEAYALDTFIDLVMDLLGALIPTLLLLHKKPL